MCCHYHRLGVGGASRIAEVEFKGYRQFASRAVRVLHGLYIMGRYIEFFGLSSVVLSPNTARDARATRKAQDKRTGHINGTTPLPTVTKKTTLSSSNDDETMSLPPALLNLVDQAKDALWALTACVTHQQRSISTGGPVLHVSVPTSSALLLPSFG